MTRQQKIQAAIDALPDAAYGVEGVDVGSLSAATRPT